MRPLKNHIIILLISCGLIPYFLFQKTQAQEQISMPTLFKQIGPKDKNLVKQNIEFLTKESKGEYQLSMLLIASAQDGDKALYKKTLAEMQIALKPMAKIVEKNSYRGWILARILLAADAMNDQTTIDETLTQINEILKDKNTTHDAFYAWILGYVAALNIEQYEKLKLPMLAAAEELNAEFKNAQAKLSGSSKQEDKDQLQAKLSDALWAWVMAAQAAANAGDNETFDKTMKEMRDITNQKTVADALTKGLLRTPASNDYPAWAISIVEQAAATIKNEAIYAELKKPLVDAITTANQLVKISDKDKAYGLRAESSLAQLNTILATNRHDHAKVVPILSKL